jgi:hypothetical protein
MAHASAPPESRAPLESAAKGWYAAGMRALDRNGLHARAAKYGACLPVPRQSRRHARRLRIEPSHIMTCTRLAGFARTTFSVIAVRVVNSEAINRNLNKSKDTKS